jgi:hypothetical protein
MKSNKIMKIKNDTPIFLTAEQVELISEHYMADKDIINHCDFGITLGGDTLVQLSDGIIKITKKVKKV